MICPSLDLDVPLKKQRAQGMPGVWLHPQPCVRMKKAHKHSHYRSRRNIDIPCAMVLTGYVVLAPVRPAFVSPSFAHHRSASLAPAARAPGRHAFAVRGPHLSSFDAARVHRIPPRDRDDAFAPRIETGCRKKDHIVLKNGNKIFFDKTEI